MTPNSSATPATPCSLGLEIAFDRVEAALATLWDDESAATKATLINLVLFADRPGALEENHRTVAALTRHHACRVLLVEATPGSPTQAWVTAHCHMIGGHKSVCSEQIAFRLDAHAPGLVRNALLAHLLSDLPVVLWAQSAASAILASGMLPHVDRLLIDSSRWDLAGIAGATRQLLDFQATTARPFALHDLAWTRSYQFRLAVAALFDHPHAQHLCAGFDRLQVRHGGIHTPTAILFAAWVARALGWHRSGGEPQHHHCTCGDGGTAIIEFVAEDSPHPLLEIDLGGPTGGVSVRRDPRAPLLQADIIDDNLPPLLLPSDPDDAGDLACAMLSRSGKNTLYLAVLPLYLEMLGTSAPWPSQSLPPCPGDHQNIT